METDGVLVKMPPKKKPLEDARKRLQEKLSNVQEQSDFICQFINDLANKVYAYTVKINMYKKRTIKSYLYMFVFQQFSIGIVVITVKPC